MTRWQKGCLVLGLCLFGCGGNDGAGTESSQGGAAGTGSGAAPPQTVATCEYLLADNCYKQSVVRARACLGDDETGTLSADRKLCDYGNGKRTDIGQPLYTPTSGGGSYLWDLKLTVGGNVCAHAVEGTGSDYDFSLTTELGVYQQTMKDGTLRITCPDRSSFEMPAAGVFDCLNENPRVTGGVGFDSASGWLNAPTIAERAHLLRCAIPM